MSKKVNKPVNKPRSKKPLYAGDPEQVNGFHGYLIGYFDWMRAMNYSEHTIRTRKADINIFVEWCEERSIRTPQEVTRAMLERYRQAVFHYRRKVDGRPLAVTCQAARLVGVRVYFRWLTKQHHIAHNPASELDLPRAEYRLPKHVLTVAEIAQILNAAEASAPTFTAGLGIRARAILETLYSTGIRRTECANLHTNDIDTERGTLMIRQGKGKKDRVVPIGERALAWIARYQNEVRHLHVDDENELSLFLTRKGEKQTGKQLSEIAKKAIDAAQLPRTENVGQLNSACHIFRHACATHMLENGADIRYIQALLGHSNMSTTEIYTQVAIHKLKAVHEATHPAKLPGRVTNSAATNEVLQVTLSAAVSDEEILSALLDSENDDDENEGE